MNEKHIALKGFSAIVLCFTMCFFVDIHNVSANSNTLAVCTSPNSCSIDLADIKVKNQKELEEVLLIKMLSLETNFKIKFDGPINGNHIQNAFKNITNKPEVLEIYGSYKVSYSDDEMNATIKYNTTNETEKKINAYVNNWVSKNIKSTMSDEQKVKAIHDYMVSNFKYNFGDSSSKSGGHLIYMPSSLIYGNGGVCQAYSTLFYRLSKKAGLESKFIAGNSQNEYFSGQHAWNMVKVSGNWYHIDVTWNDPIPDNPNVIRYDYYLKSDNYMSKSHIWDRSKYPKAPKNYK